MRVKTSVTLPEELLARIDRVERNRPAFVEKASWVYLANLERQRRNPRDLEMINANADRLNAEAEAIPENSGSSSSSAGK